MSYGVDTIIECKVSYLLLLHYTNPDSLDSLKCQFKKEIASTRTMYRIKSLQQLVKVLKKRGLITIANLNKVASVLPPDMYNEYQAIGTACANRLYNHLSLETIGIKQTLQTNSTYQYINNDKEKIYRIICNELGPRHWKSVARNLELSEKEIDVLNSQYHANTDECIRQILRMHEERCDPSLWRQKLLFALDRGGRMDLKLKVEQKLDEYNIIRIN